jgi:hypothetical protein
MTRASLTVHVDVVDEAIREINAMWRQGGLNTIVAIGDYLIRIFYSGDLELAQSRSPTKEKRLSELFARVDELLISRHALQRAVPIALQYRALPRQLADGLSVEHHAALLPLPQIESKVALARRAVDDGWTSKELGREVRREKKPQPGGRPPGPELLKLSGRLVRTVRTADLAKLVKPSGVRQLDEKQRERLLADLYTVRAALERIEDALAKR